MSAKISLQNAPVFRAIEHRAPGFELAHAIGRFFCVQLRHPPLLTYCPPRMVSAKCTFQLSRSSTLRERGGDPAFRHHGVRFAQQAICKPSRPHAGRGSFDRSAQTRAAGADDEDVVLEGFVSGMAKVTGYERQRFNSTNPRLEPNRARCPSSTGARKDRRSRPRTNSSMPTSCAGD